MNSTLRIWIDPDPGALQAPGIISPCLWFELNAFEIRSVDGCYVKIFLRVQIRCKVKLMPGWVLQMFWFCKKYYISYPHHHNIMLNLSSLKAPSFDISMTFTFSGHLFSYINIFFPLTAHSDVSRAWSICDWGYWETGRIIYPPDFFTNIDTLIWPTSGGRGLIICGSPHEYYILIIDN